MIYIVYWILGIWKNLSQGINIISHWRIYEIEEQVEMIERMSRKKPYPNYLINILKIRLAAGIIVLLKRYGVNPVITADPETLRDYVNKFTKNYKVDVVEGGRFKCLGVIGIKPWGESWDNNDISKLIVLSRAVIEKIRKEEE